MAQENVNLPVGQILELVKAAVAEAKKPSAEEQEKQAQAKMLKAREREETIRIGKETEERDAFKRAQCARTGHRKENGKPATGGQMLNNGKALLLCLRCGERSEIQFDNVTRSAIDRGDVSLEEMAFPA